jgi:hypothetical protein
VLGHGSTFFRYHLITPLVVCKRKTLISAFSFEPYSSIRSSFCSTTTLPL